MINTFLLRELTAALGRLASPASAQIEYLTGLGVADLTDELALEFDDMYRPLSWQLEAVAGGAAAMAACQTVDAALLSNTVGWYFEDLSSEPWRLIRKSAARALTALESLPTSDEPRHP